VKNDLQFVFMGDSYTVGWGLWYYYWCENKLYDHINFQKRYIDVDASHSIFTDNKALMYTWENRFPALVASHFDTDYRTNCWEDVGVYSTGGADRQPNPYSRESVHTAATAAIVNYLTYFKKYGNETRKFFIIQTSDPLRDTMLCQAYDDIDKDNIIKKIEESRSAEEAFGKLLLNSEYIHSTGYLPRNKFPYSWPRVGLHSFGDKLDIIQNDNLEKILYHLWESVWGNIEIELKKYNCELLLVHSQEEFYKNVKLENTIEIPPDGFMHSYNYEEMTIKKEIYNKYNIVIEEKHPGLQLHQRIADSIIKYIEEHLK
jgi:hypothetical protein